MKLVHCHRFFSEPPVWDDSQTANNPRWMIPKGSQMVTGGKRSATTGIVRHNFVHPEGMPDGHEKPRSARCRVSGIPSGCSEFGVREPVVARCLPPATFLNSFGIREGKP
jgi:hypothetical protein